MLIGVCGQAGSGKSTVAQFLVKHYGFIEVSFADPMKRFVQDVFDMTDAQIWGPSENRNAEDMRYPDPAKPRHGLTPRFALQTLGTEWGRNCYPQVWVDYAIRVHARLQEGGYAYDQQRGLYTVSTLMDRRVNPDAMMWPKINVVISDVRFKNEVGGIREAGGDVFRIVRPGAEGKVGIAGHASESEQQTLTDEMFDGVILNNSTLDNLYEIINRVVIPLVQTKQK